MTIKSLWKQVIKSPSPEILRQDVNIDEWKRIYQGNSDWLEYQEVNVDGVARKRRLKTINPAKIICQEMASLIFSEQPKVDAPKALLDVLDNNSFFDNQQLDIERQCALGSQAVKIRVKNGKIKYDYITAENFIPLTWDNSRVTEAAFLDHRVIKGENYTRVETHKLYYPETPMSDGQGGMMLDDKGLPIMVQSEDPTGYQITNELFKHDNDKARKADISALMPDVVESQVVEVEEPLFVYIKNPIANNQNSTTPIGISMYGNAIDTLHAIDIAFNNMAEAPELCKPRIMVSDKLTRTVIDQDGNRKKVFDTSDRVYRTAPMTHEEGHPIQDLSIPLEHEQIRRQIQTELDILSVQVGFSAGTLSFDGSGGLKTATEVISDNSKTYKTRQKYVNALNNGYNQLFKSTLAMIVYEGLGVSGDFTITWDDSIIEDKNATAAYWLGLAGGQIVPKWMAIQSILKVDEKKAKEIEAEVKASAPVNEIDFLGG